MLANFVIQLLMICSALILTGWAVETVSRRASWPARRVEREPNAQDSGFTQRIRS